MFFFLIFLAQITAFGFLIYLSSQMHKQRQELADAIRERTRKEYEQATAERMREHETKYRSELARLKRKFP